MRTVSPACPYALQTRLELLVAPLPLQAHAAGQAAKDEPSRVSSAGRLASRISQGPRSDTAIDDLYITILGLISAIGGDTAWAGGAPPEAFGLDAGGKRTRLACLREMRALQQVPAAGSWRRAICPHRRINLAAAYSPGRGMAQRGLRDAKLA
jgi:hypothetical protein